MSRATAYHTLSLADYEAAMEGIYTTSVCESTIDESPMAYKSLEDIVDVVGDTVEILDIMKPVYNFKASDDTPPWRKNKEKSDEGADCQPTA